MFQNNQFVRRVGRCVYLDDLRQRPMIRAVDCQRPGSEHSQDIANVTDAEHVQQLRRYLSILQNRKLQRCKELNRRKRR